MARAVVREGVDHVARVGTLQGMVARLLDKNERAGARGYPSVASEDLGYTQLLMGYPQAALASLRTVTVPRTNAGDRDVERAASSALVADLLKDGEYAAVAQLDEWAQQSADALGITRG
jgi:hypothetical protein